MTRCYVFRLHPTVKYLISQYTQFGSSSLQDIPISALQHASTLLLSCPWTGSVNLTHTLKTNQPSKEKSHLLEIGLFLTFIFTSFLEDFIMRLSDAYSVNWRVVVTSVNKENYNLVFYKDLPLFLLLFYIHLLYVFTYLLHKIWTFYIKMVF